MSRSLTSRSDIRTPRGLGLALPIDAGERVLVVGSGLQALAGSLANTNGRPVLLAPVRELSDVPDGVETRRLTSTSVPLEAGEVDHAIVVGGMRRGPVVSPTEVARVVAPGGGVLVARTVVGRLASPRRTAEAVEEELEGAGVDVLERYGVRQHLGDIRHLVPFEPAGLRWYLRDATLPWSRRGAVASRMAAAVAPVAVLLRAFPGVAVVGRRREDPPC